LLTIVPPNTKSNIKLAKLRLLRGLWISKFDFGVSSDVFIEAIHMFEEVTGETVNYFGTNCMLEVGSNFLR
jgi:hypothetical protein